MCGLIGFSGKQAPDLFKLSAILTDNDSRGGHSTGLYINKEFIKTVGTSINVIPKLSNLKDVEHMPMAIGHTRYATHGVKTAENSHPYKFGKIIGAHNGVLSNYEEVSKQFKLKVPDVDSKAIFKVLNKTKDYKNLGKFDGTIAVLFTDDNESLYVYRRNNPLYKCVTDEGVYFSSLEDSFTFEGEVTEVPANILFKYVNGEIVSQTKIKFKPIASIKKINTDWRSYGSYNNYNSWGASTYTKKTSVNSPILYDHYGDYEDVQETEVSYGTMSLADKLDNISDIIWDFKEHMTHEQITAIKQVERDLEDQLIDAHKDTEYNELPF